MAAPKIKTPTQEAIVLEAIAKYDRRGYTQEEIVKQLKADGIIECSQGTVSRMLAKIRERYKARAAESRAEKVAEMIDQLREVRKEAWAAWERSKEDRERVVEEHAVPLKRPAGPEVPLKKGLGDKLPVKGADASTAAESLRRLKSIVTKEGRIPANEYLQTILKTLEDERKLLGLDEAQKVDLSGSVNVLNWDAIALAHQDPVEDKLTKLEAAVVTKSLPAPIPKIDEADPD